MFEPNFKILGQADPEKSLTKKKKLTDRQTDILTEKANTIYPLYTSYIGGIIKRWIRLAVICCLIHVYHCLEVSCKKVDKIISVKHFTCFGYFLEANDVMPSNVEV